MMYLDSHNAQEAIEKNGWGYLVVLLIIKLFIKNGNFVCSLSSVF